jgi:hypothetical protein
MPTTLVPPAPPAHAGALDRLNISPSQAPTGSLAAVLAPLRRLASLVASEELAPGGSEGQSEPTPVAMIAPMHGPVVKQAVTELVGR